MKKEIFDELNEISPLLAKKGKIEDGFKIPDRYFDQMTRQVMEQIRLTPQPIPAGKHPSFFKAFMDWASLQRSALARYGIAFILFACLAAGAVRWGRNSASSSVDAKSLTQTDPIHQYIAARPDEFDEQFILDNQTGKEIAGTNGSEDKNLGNTGSISTDKDDLEKMLREELQEEALNEGKL